jgi:FKBP-type peptidyl-prolyl cis-trans isomerase SlyD
MSNESEADETTDDAEEQAAETQADAEATETEETETESEETEETGLQRGDFVTVAYTARTVEDGTLVDTTDPEVAEEEGVGEDQEFAPRTIVLGEGHVFGAVEDDIVGKEVGDTGTVTVAAAEAFGEFDEDEVRTISTDRIPEDDRYPGAHVDIDGEHGHVETVIGGRARVDFNHPLAGEDVEYEYETVDEVEDREAKAQALMDTFLDIDLEMWFETDVEEEEQLVEPDEDEEAETEEAETDEPDEGEEDEADEPDKDEEAEEPEPEYETVEVEKETLYIEATPQLTMNQQWMMGKQRIAQQLVDQLGVDRVIVQETLGEGMGMGGLGGMMGGMGGDDIEEALEDEDIDAEELVEEIEGASE